MLRLPTVFSVPVAFALVGFGIDSPGEAASIAYPFNATYNVSATSRYIGFGVSQVSLFSESTDACSFFTGHLPTSVYKFLLQPRQSAATCPQA